MKNNDKERFNRKNSTINAFKKRGNKKIKFKQSKEIFND